VAAAATEPDRPNHRANRVFAALVVMGGAVVGALLALILGTDEEGASSV
jgi:hypothetical protein